MINLLPPEITLLTLVIKLIQQNYIGKNHVLLTIIVHSTYTCNAIAKKYEKNQLMCMFTHIV